MASNDDTVQPLLERLTEKSWEERRGVVAALAHAGDAALPGLRDVLIFARDDETRLASSVEALVASAGNVDAVLLPIASESTAPAVLCDVLAVLGRRRSKRAIPACEALVSHKDGNVSLAAIEALGRLGGGAGTAALIAVVQTRDFFRTFPAIEVLGKSRDTRAVSLLIELLDDPLYASAAARALGDTHDPRSVEALMRSLQSGDDGIAFASAQSLASLARADGDRFTDRLSALPMRKEASAVIHRAWQQANAEERGPLAHLLAVIGGPSAMHALLEIVKADEETSPATADALHDLGRQADAPILEILAGGTSRQRAMLLPIIGSAPGGLGPLLACLTDAVDEVRSAAADALARIGDPAAVDALFELLSDKNTQVVQSAIAAIQSLGSAHTEAKTLHAATSDDTSVRRAAFRIIAYFGYKSGIDLLLNASRAEEERERTVAIAGLPYLEDPRAREALIAAVNHPSARTRAVATRALGDLEAAPDIEATLVLALCDEDAWVRYYACLCVGRLELTGLVDSVVSHLEDGAGQVRVAAIEALGHLKDPRAKRALEQATASKDLDVRRAALVGLGAFGDPDAIAVLLKHVAADDPSVRLMALSSLAKHDDPRVVRALRQAAFDTDVTVHQSVVSLLGTRHDAPSTQALIDLIDQRSLTDLVIQTLASDEAHILHISAALDTSSRERSIALSQALVRFRKPRAEAALVEALTVPNVFARRAAATALAASTDPMVRATLLQVGRNDDDAEVRERAEASAS